MRIKLGVLFLMAVIASAGMGVSYSVGNGDFNTNNGYCNLAKFSAVKCGDNEVEKEVATVIADIISGNKGIDVSVSNAYPGYGAWVNFTMMNIFDDNKPIYVTGVSLEGNYGSALSLNLEPDLVGKELGYWGATLDGNLTVLISDDATQGTQYKFWVNISFSDQC